jgi:hypothetical protein
MEPRPTIPAPRRLACGRCGVAFNCGLDGAAAHSASEDARERAFPSEASGQRGNSMVRAPDTRSEAGLDGAAALASEESGQRGNSMVRAPDTRPEAGLDGAHCWCAAEQFRLPMPASETAPANDCLCPSCLRAAAQAVG